ncbi:MAG TPA: hypothetical protein ENG09_03640 [Candidatus Syntrophoarchaeum butanivorans]|uniref:Phosphohydrolase n=1 Tax=Candidatus Syntropharchaeum butanivorans TaxID=1839936 RepID=A0A1F2P6D6_9EURY|nr:MAG: phosphohydrolase [Candidatus Syntrophoarchaeum butanivorans]RJS72091.1 MAG: hypothetical protein CW694_03565 [Candidatus Syntrophoarchaeum sp. WYZ-LMO15]HDM36331.1 hypothetical protein [Candidatus Syntrophoarchaeum butanivorans]HEC57256.1 hypothetical protein [Candidatus Syntrophoarchaeum butanivorans]
MTIEEVLAQMKSSLSESIPKERAEAVTEGIGRVFGKLKARATPSVDLMEYLNEESDWTSITALESDKNLIEYSLAVTEEMLANAGGDVTEESCVLVGLFHGIGVASFGDDRLEIHEGEDPEITRMKVGSRSLQILADFTPVEPHEAQAILYQCVEDIPVERLKITELLTDAIKKCA